MAKFEITDKTTVAELKEQFRKEFDGVLHILLNEKGTRSAEDNDLLVSLGAKTGIYECRASRTVGKFEEAFLKEFNLNLNVFTADDWVAVLDGITLETIKKLPKQTTKKDMEKFIAYQRNDDEPEYKIFEVPQYFKDNMLIVAEFTDPVEEGDPRLKYLFSGLDEMDEEEFEDSGLSDTYKDYKEYQEAYESYVEFWSKYNNDNSGYAVIIAYGDDGDTVGLEVGDIADAYEFLTEDFINYQCRTKDSDYYENVKFRFISTSRLEVFNCQGKKSWDFGEEIQTVFGAYSAANRFYDGYYQWNHHQDAMVLFTYSNGEGKKSDSFELIEVIDGCVNVMVDDKKTLYTRKEVEQIIEALENKDN